VLLPPHCAGARDVEVSLTADTLRVRVCGGVMLSPAADALHPTP